MNIRTITIMDIENPLQNDNIPIAKMVCIEVMGEPASEDVQEPVYKSYIFCFSRGLSYLFFCVCGFACFFGILFYVFVFPL